MPVCVVVAVNATSVARAVTIAGSDSGGGGGIEADVKTFLGCGVHGSVVVTAVTAQNSIGVSGFYEIPPDGVLAQLHAVLDDIGTDAVKTGMLASAAIINAVAEALPLGSVPIVVDPIAASKHGDPLLREDALAALRDRLVPMATVVTPNLAEARLLTGLEITNRDEQIEAARRVRALGPAWVLVTGGRLADADARDVLFDGHHVHEVTAPRTDTAHVHGSGDTLAGAITAGLAQGLSVPDAVATAKDYVTQAIAASYPLGAGIGPVGHAWRLATSRTEPDDHDQRSNGSAMTSPARNRGSSTGNRPG
ncbi:MAG: bifunctional hydroxymethylpyrimidine kinase/phosphomethylpyrimidine kinase [Nocardioidaceae bacterium]